MTIGSLVKVHEITTKNGSKMAFITFSDGYITYEFTIFPQEYSAYADLLVINFIYKLKCYYKDSFIIQELAVLK